MQRNKLENELGVTMDEPPPVKADEPPPPLVGRLPRHVFRTARKKERRRQRRQEAARARNAAADSADASTSDDAAEQAEQYELKLLAWWLVLKLTEGLTCSVVVGARSEEARRRWETRNAELDAAAAEKRRKEEAERDLQQVCLGGRHVSVFSVADGPATLRSRRCRCE